MLKRSKPLRRLAFALLGAASLTAFAYQESSPGYVAEITDTAGATTRVKSLSADNADDFNGRTAHMGARASIPIVIGAGTYIFVDVDKLQEYRLTGGEATVTLANGEVIKGKPCGECSITGEGTLGKIKIAADKVQSLKILDVAKATTLVQDARRYLPQRQDDGKRLRITTKHGDVFSVWVFGLQFPYRHSGCDEHWIPCRPWSGWTTDQKLAIQYGESEAQLDFNLVKQLEFKDADPKLPRPFALVLKTGESVTGKTKDRDGLAGLLNHGAIYVPFASVQSIEFVNEKQLSGGR
jgi:hypothetical protein